MCILKSNSCFVILLPKYNEHKNTSDSHGLKEYMFFGYKNRHIGIKENLHSNFINSLGQNF